MKLRNKKTGEVVKIHDTEAGDEHIYLKIVRDGSFSLLAYNSLAELNEEWEDYKEPKYYWYITGEGDVIKDHVDGEWAEYRKSIGNYFETKEEAEKAVEKLKAWKRLKDKGFRFDGWKRDERYYGDFTITASDQISCDDKDLDLLFGGEE